MNFKEFKNKYEKVPVELCSHNVPDNPTVSVCVQTYQHEDYIQDCLDGILMQETNFPFEILLGEDASTDRTREICIEYAEKYPDRIKLFLHHRENNIAIAGQPTGQFNFLYNLYSANATYIALCDGDDYWTDPLKLQKQVNFLETNQKYCLAVGGYKSINVKTGEEKKKIKIVVNYLDCTYGYSFSKTDITRGWITKTLTALFRKNAIEDLNYNNFNFFRDVHLFYHILQKGNGFYFAEVLGAYREHPNGIFSSSDREDRIISHYYIYKELFNHYGDEPARIMFVRFLEKIITEGNSNFKKFQFFSLVKEGASIVKSKTEWWLLIKAVLRGIKKTVFNSFGL